VLKVINTPKVTYGMKDKNRDVIYTFYLSPPTTNPVKPIDADDMTLYNDSILFSFNSAYRLHEILGTGGRRFDHSHPDQ